jgi:hypothetical protein
MARNDRGSRIAIADSGTFVVAVAKVMLLWSKPFGMGGPPGPPSETTMLHG